MTRYECLECATMCTKSRKDIEEMELDPDSEYCADRTIFCPRGVCDAVFEKVEEDEEVTE